MNKAKKILLALLFIIAFTAGTSYSAFAGWEKEEKWSYYDENGIEKKNEWFVDESGKSYFFDQGGQAVTGWYDMGTNGRYFFDKKGAMVTGMAEIDGLIYYFEPDGRLFHGNKMVGNVMYLFKQDGILIDDKEAALYGRYNGDGEILSGMAEGQKKTYLYQFPAIVFFVAGVILFRYRKKEKGRAYLWLIYVAVLMASIPLFLPYLIRGHDMTFHLNRILGIEESLRMGMFPVRLNSYSLNGYGYADPIFYPQLFLYIPALLHMAGLPFVTAVNLFLLLVHAATAAVMYGCSKSLFRSREIGCMSSAVYTLCVYRLCNIYTRAAYGEATAMIFLPLIVYGFYELFFGDEKKWMFLTLGITGVVQSHILSTMFVSIFCILGGICCIKRILVKKRLIPCLKMIASTITLNLFFLIPLIQYMGTEIDTGALKMNAEENAVPLTKLLEVFPKASGATSSIYRDLSDVMPISLGLGLLCGLVVFLYLILTKREICRLAKVLFFTGIAITVCGTVLFPWSLLVKNKWYALFAEYVQYPWRFVGIGSCFLSMVAAYGFYYVYNGKDRRKICLAALVLSVISAQYMICDYTRNQASVWSEKNVTSIVGQWEYLYPGTDKQHLNQEVIPSDGQLIILEHEKKGLSVHVSYEINGDMDRGYIDVPLLFYPGYHAFNERGEEMEIQRGEGNLVRVMPDAPKGSVNVAFKEPDIWRIAEIISFMTIAWVVIELVCRGRKKNG